MVERHRFYHQRRDVSDVVGDEEEVDKDALKFVVAFGVTLSTPHIYELIIKEIIKKN